MADITDDNIIEDSPANPGADVEMAEGAEEEEAANGADRSELPFAEEDIAEPVAARITFISYLTSPIVTLLVGTGESETILTAHQGLLTLSPYFKEACAQFSDDGSVSNPVPVAHIASCLRLWTLHAKPHQTKAF